MKRVIKDYKNISQEHIDLINEHFPNGFENDNLISFTTPKGEFIKALEIRTDDTIYLFKIDKNMRVDDDENQDNEGLAMSEFENFKGGGDEEEEEEDDADEEPKDEPADDSKDSDED